YRRHEPRDQLVIEGAYFVGIARQEQRPGIDKAAATQVEQADPFVAALPMCVAALLRTQFVIIDRMIMLIKPHHHASLVSRIIRDEEVGSVANKNSGRIKKAVGLEKMLDGGVKPLQPLSGGHILEGFAQRVLVA